MMEEEKAVKVFIEKTTDRKSFKEMMNFARTGDMIIVGSVSCTVRNTRDLLGVVLELVAKGVESTSLKEQIDTTTLTGRFTLAGKMEKSQASSS